MPSTPPRRNPPTHNFSLPEKTPLETLMFLGISRARAERALAATGNGCPRKAMNWLISHVNDSKVDDNLLREYTLVAVPVGPFGEQLINFWHDSRELCHWNEAHNSLPHVTLVSFFKATADMEPHITRSVRAMVQSLNAYLEKRIDLRLHQDADFIGFYINTPDEKYFENIATTFVDAVKSINIEEYNPSSALLACCPWASQTCTPTHSPARLNPISGTSRGSMDVNPEMQKIPLHLALAQKYDKMDSITLSSMLDRFDYVDASVWELRLYSRDERIGNMIGNYQTFRVTSNYRAKAHDELTLNVDDYMLASELSVNNGDEAGWVYGTSLTTGISGYFPENHVLRVPESETWSLHTQIQIIGSGQGHFHIQESLVNLMREPEESLEDCARAAIDSTKKIIPWNPTIGKLRQKHNVSQKLFIMRHAERVDYAFSKWTDHCFAENGVYDRLDLNLPLVLPDRLDGKYRYPWKFDTPITNAGVNQSYLTGQFLNKTNVTFGLVYSSPSFRCIQTAQALLDGMEASNELKIRVEPALFEWCAHYTEIPQFLTLRELSDAGYNIDVDYSPVVTYEELKSKHRRESLEEFYDRNNRISELSVKLTSGNVLIVGHAANLETNSRLLLNGTTMALPNLKELMSKIPYASLLVLEKNEHRGHWCISTTSVLPLSHSRNFQFDPRIFAELHRPISPRLF